MRQEGRRREGGESELNIAVLPHGDERHRREGWQGRRERLKTTTYQFWALLCGCHPCEAGERRGEEKGRRLPLELECVVHVEKRANMRKKEGERDKNRERKLQNNVKAVLI